MVVLQLLNAEVEELPFMVRPQTTMTSHHKQTKNSSFQACFPSAITISPWLDAVFVFDLLSGYCISHLENQQVEDVYFILELYKLFK